MRTLALLLVLLPSFVLAQEPAASPPPQQPPPPKSTKDQVYKWVDKDGVTHYSSQPPSQNATPAKLPPLQTYKGGTAPNLNKFQKATTKGGETVAPAAAQIDVVTPSHDETFRSGAVPVAVVVTPQIGEGQRLIYLLDGRPASAPTTDTSYALTDVERGSHTVSVTLIDADGAELGSSTGVTFHMKRTIADKADQAKPPAQPPAKPKPKPP